eukprot:NODE_5458_length_311_cov_261.664122_g4846_i0.p2 GENE.NODE_5458_length_311_cov_261.664122_g4846_i0~~NODE_5458_length_311_cov_261.664122_g4846_i0.p2  ORF type:complete len:85 (+),score=11.49 NODE_5458_length_311_cov_261.664122_g4846_i0:11-265(+)
MPVIRSTFFFFFLWVRLLHRVQPFCGVCGHGCFRLQMVRLSAEHCKFLGTLQVGLELIGGNEFGVHIIVNQLLAHQAIPLGFFT